MSPDTEKKVITITLIKNWLKTIDLQDMMGYSKKSSQELRKYLKINRAPFPPELTTRKSSPLLSKKFLPPVKILPMILVQNPNYPLSHWLLFHPQSLPIFYWMRMILKVPDYHYKAQMTPPWKRRNKCCH